MLVGERDSRRAARDWQTADALREKLRTMGVIVDDRANTWAMAQWRTSPDSSSIAVEAYSNAWHERHSTLKHVSLEAVMASSGAWLHMPRLQTYREMLGKRAEERHRLSVALGELLGNFVRRNGDGTVLCIEKPYLPGFARGFAHTTSGHPIVLVAINGGDEPLTCELQSLLIGSLPGLRRCYANNLHAPVTEAAKGTMLPLPLGACPIGHGALPTIEADRLLMAARSRAPPWECRDRRLLVAPMRLRNSRLRAAYFEVLSRPEYARLVLVVVDRLPFVEFLALLANHTCTLSPPGRGYDCFRTWQALALGTVPLIAADQAFAPLDHLGPKCLPRPSELTPERLGALLDSLSPPYERAVQLETWQRHWSADLVAAPGPG